MHPLFRSERSEQGRGADVASHASSRLVAVWQNHDAHRVCNWGGIDLRRVKRSVSLRERHHCTGVGLATSSSHPPRRFEPRASPSTRWIIPIE